MMGAIHQAALAFDFLRAKDALDGEDLREGDLRASAARHKDLFQFGNAFAELPQVADANRVALPALDGLHDVHAADGDFDDILHVADADAVAGDSVAVDFKLEIRLADDPVGHDVGRAGNLLEQLLNLQTDALDFLQVAPVNLHAHHGAKAGLQHDEARLDRLQECRQHAGNGRLLLKLGEDFILRDAAVFGPNPVTFLFRRRRRLVS